ncbi:MAG: EamA family transporter [Patescibacteria group bacterium]|nr:EamA family transporter [Patescibacteria group bacterium]
MPWYIFATLTPIFYSFTNFIEKFLIEKRIKNPLVLLVVSGFISLFIGLAILVVRDFPTLGLKQTAIIIFAGLLLKLYLIPYLQALKIEDASRVVPLFQIVPIVVLSLAWLILGETMRPIQIVGAVLVVFGGLILGGEKIKGKVFKIRKAFWYMMLSSIMYASILVLFRISVKENSVWNLLGYEYIGTGIGGLILLTVPSIKKSFLQEFNQVKKIFGYVFINDSFAIVAQVAEAVAISMVPVALVSIVAGTQPIILLIFGILLSIFFPKIIKEDIAKKTILNKIASIALIFFGLYLVYFN